MTAAALVCPAGYKQVTVLFVDVVQSMDIAEAQATGRHLEIMAAGVMTDGGSR